MAGEYTSKEMLQWLEAHFTEMGYEVTRYSDDFLPVRVSLYCKKELDGECDELVVELTTNSTISKDDWFRIIEIGGVDIEASSINFYQYYFIKAKIYLAYPDYVAQNKEFNEFKKRCLKKGIGLLRVSEKVKKGKQDHVEEVCNACPLFEEISDELNIEDADIKNMRLEYYLRNCLHYFVYYPKPDFKRRAITGRMEGDISFRLIDKLCELENVAYRNKLMKVGSEYRRETRDDYQIALETIKELWLDVGKVKYPEIQRRLEDILLRSTEYRDHFLHQFQVFLLGACIIDKLYANEKCIKEFRKRYKCPIEKAWVFASTYHDFNYSIQQYDIWIEDFWKLALNVSETAKELSSLRLDAAFIRENYLLKTEEICKSLQISMDNTDMNFFYEQVVKRRNHGLLSALSLLKLFENKRSQVLDHSALVQAAVAIAIHDFDVWRALLGGKGGQDDPWYCNFAQKKYLRNLQFSKDPLPFLLIFCDTVQEWGRVGKNYKKSEPLLEDIAIDSAEILVSISVKDDQFYDEKEREIKGVKKFLKDPRFKIELISRKGGQKNQIEMKGS